MGTISSHTMNLQESNHLIIALHCSEITYPCSVMVLVTKSSALSDCTNSVTKLAIEFSTEAIHQKSYLLPLRLLPLLEHHVIFFGTIIITSVQQLFLVCLPEKIGLHFLVFASVFLPVQHSRPSCLFSDTVIDHKFVLKLNFAIYRANNFYF
jgi:hypothetical protein